MTGLSGLANALILAIINNSAELIMHDDIQGHYILLYLIAFVLYIYTQKYALDRMVVAVEQYIQAVKIRIADKIRQTSLVYVQQADRSELYTRLTQESHTISESAILLTLAAQSAMVLAFTLLYLAYISILSFLITLLFIALVTSAFVLHESGIASKIKQINRKESHFLNGIGELIDGFKEIRISRAKSDGLYAAIRTVSDETELLRKQVSLRQVNTMIFSRIAFYALLAILVFSVPYIQASNADEVIKITTTVLFIIGPINLLMTAMPTAAKSNVALDNLAKLEQELDAAALSPQAEANNLQEFADFKSIQLSGVEFSYRDTADQATFHMGPLDLTINQGELLFIVGNNGSGKSTLLKVLTGLYPLQAGALIVDGVTVTPANRLAYQNLLTSVFSDYHLFDRPYGLDGLDADEVNRLLKLMQLEDKLQYAHGEFSAAHLSSGEERRLAFMAAILEHKPVCIFDEPAADQDPAFRQYFYATILPGLQAQGKTIVLVSHDEQYFALADRVVKMQRNQITELAHDPA